LGYIVKEYLDYKQVATIYDSEDGYGSKREAWLAYADKLQGSQGLLGCLGVWIQDQTPEHLEGLVVIDLRKY